MTKKGTPLKDGSGMGEKANYNRGGCHDGEVCEISDVIRRAYPGRDKWCQKDRRKK